MNKSSYNYESLRLNPHYVSMWMATTTQDYRRGFVEGNCGDRNCYLLEQGATDKSEYDRGFIDGRLHVLQQSKEQQ